MTGYIAVLALAGGCFVAVGVSLLALTGNGRPRRRRSRLVRSRGVYVSNSQSCPAERRTEG